MASATGASVAVGGGLVCPLTGVTVATWTKPTEVGADVGLLAADGVAAAAGTSVVVASAAADGVATTPSWGLRLRFANRPAANTRATRASRAAATTGQGSRR